MTRITHLMMDDSMFYDLSDLPYILCYTGAFFSLLVEIYRSSWIHMIIPVYEIHIDLVICLYFIMISQWSLS